MTPAAQQSILGRLRKACATAVAVHQTHLVDLVPANARVVGDLRDYYAGLDDALGWKAANQNDPEKIDALKTLFVTSKHVATSGDRDLVLPNKLAIQKFADVLVDAHTKRIGVVGERGSGKTIATNYVLSCNGNLFAANNMTWFRADVAKLHAINEELAKAQRRRVSLHEYMALHAFWVTWHYSKNDPALKRFDADVEATHHIVYDQKRAQITPFVTFVNRQSGNAKTKLIPVWLNAMKSASEAARFPRLDDQDLRRFIELCTRKQTERQAASLFELFFRFLKTPFGTMPPCRTVALLFDGVDNLRCDALQPRTQWIGGKSWRTWYLGYLDEMSTYLNGGMLALPYDKVVVVVRSETVLDARNRMGNGGMQFQGGNRIRFDVARPGVHRVALQKIAGIRQKPAVTGLLRFVNETDKKGDKIAEHLLRFEWAYVTLVAAFERELKGVTGEHARIEMVARHVFGGNLRSFSRNVVRSFRYVDEYVRSLHTTIGMFATAVGRKDFLMSHAGMLFEGSVLAGNSYVLPNSSKDVRGRWCPNLFEVSGFNTWDGLLLLRILQSFPQDGSMFESVTVRSVIESLSILGFPEDRVVQAIFVAQDFNLLRCDGHFGDSTDDHQLRFRKTAKGRFIELLPFTNVAALYLLATGSRYSALGDGAYVVSHAKGYSPRPGYVHYNSGSRAFWSAAALSTVLLIRHILSAHALEIARIESARIAPELRSQLLSAYGAAPNFEIVLGQLVIHVAQSTADEQAVLTRYLKDILRDG